MATTTQASSCEPCSRSEIKSPGYSFCSDCEEILCLACDKAHNIGKMTLSHRTTNMEKLPPFPIEAIPNIRYCEIHTGKCVDFFCSFHDVLCCKTCIVENHRSCDKIVVVDDICKDVKSSAIVEQVSKAVIALLKTYDFIIEDRTLNKKSVLEDEENIRCFIDNLKEVLIHNIETLERSLLFELDKQRSEIVLKLDKEMDEAVNLREKLLSVKQEFDFNLEHGSNKKLYLLSEKLKHRFSAQEAHVQNILASMETIRLTHKSEKKIDAIISAFASLGVDKYPCEIQHLRQMNKSAQHAPLLLTMKPAKGIDLASLGCTSITGIEIVNGDQLIVCDYSGNRLLLYQENGTLLKDRNVGNRPYDITLIPSGITAAVAIPDAKKIFIIDTKSLESVRQISTSLCCYGIQFISNTLVVGGDNFLVIMSMEGKINRSLTLPSNSSVRYIRKGVDDTLLFTNYYKMFCIRLIDETQLFTYKSSTEARGIAVDQYGYIYVADKQQNKIHRLSPNGSFVDTVLCETDGIGSPLALRFSKDYSKLYVGMTQNTILSIYHCS